MLLTDHLQVEQAYGFDIYIKDKNSNMITNKAITKQKAKTCSFQIMSLHHEKHYRIPSTRHMKKFTTHLLELLLLSQNEALILNIYLYAFFILSS